MKKKILIIIPGIPYPPIDGHKLKIYNLIKILVKKFDLHIVSISPKELSEEETFFIKSHSYKFKHFKINYFSSFFRLIKNIFAFSPYQVSYYTLEKVKKYLKEETIEDEYVLFNLIRTAEYYNQLVDKKFVLDIVDVLSKSYYNSYLNTTSKIYKLIYWIESKRLIDYEIKIVKSVDLTICVNRDEADSLNPYGNVKCIPNGVNKKLFNFTDFDPNYSNSIVFFGAMHYQPNIDAVVWLDKYVLDHIDEKINLIIIGTRPTKEVLQISNKRPNVKVTGFLENPYVILNSCLATISPMQNGGGIQNKVLESMALGKINILTTFCALPIIGGMKDTHFLVADSPIDMANLINDIFYNKDAYKYIGENAKELISKEYTWESYESKLIKELEKL